MEAGDGTRSRRDFIKGAGVLAGGAWLSAHMGEVLAAAAAARSQHQEGAAYRNIDSDVAPVLAAVADQVYPPDDVAGAVDLGAIHFIDNAIAGFMAGAWPMIRDGLRDFDGRSRAETGLPFHELSFDDQTARLRVAENEPFFGMVHFLTLLGCFTLPEYGGNRDLQGWAQLGFERRHSWQPPFGDYDAEAMTTARTGSEEGADHGSA
jgi:hypothetical protein